jgi:hypothetical protein
MPPAATLPAFYAAHLKAYHLEMYDPTQQENGSTFRDLYPTLTDQELKEAERNFTRYFEIALDIYRELHAGAGDVDMSPSERMIKERSKHSQKL